MKFRILALAFLLSLSMAGEGFAKSKAVPEPATPPNYIDTVEGVYKNHFQNGLVTGESYMSEDILEIMKVTPQTAYIRYDLNFYNGHTCALWGIADLEQDKLVFRDPGKDTSCTLSIETKGKQLISNDITPQSAEQNCHYYCGARGSFNNVIFDIAAKRKISYTNRIKASKEFKEAMTAYMNKKNTTNH